MKKSLLIIAIAAALTGCASYQQALSGYETSAVVGIKAADDRIISVWTHAACGTPLSAIYRHPELVATLKALCMPTGADSNPALLFETPMVPAK